MREIKFRIWDVAPVEDGFAGLMIEMNYATQSRYLIDAINGKYPIMQYTGLKVKDNKELFYGDIVRHNENKFVVCFRENFGFCLIDLKKYDSKNTLLMAKDNWRSYEDVWRMKKYVEIIGNIYENPDLIKGE